ncbi:UNVERIFIED_CONTAM: hypothetical protein HDU68_001911 [Siphonaria sp. JEL0065]|nr:hypothetical protein HDU68_001911 [Siphonaria sp. JEL0065]
MTSWCRSVPGFGLFVSKGSNDTFPDCIVRIGSNPIVLATVPLVVLLVFAAIPAMFRAVTVARRKALTQLVPNDEEEESRPLLSSASTVSGSRLSSFEREWMLASQDPNVSPPQPPAFYFYRFIGHVLSVLLLVLAAQWELVKELSDGREESLADWIASILFVTQMAIALILFVYSAKTVTQKPHDSDMFIEFQKRHNRLILFRLAIFHALSASVWNFVVIAVWPLWQSGDISTHFFLLGLGMLVGGLFMAVICVLTRDSIQTRRIHRLKVDGKIPSPELDASFFSRLTFSWFDPMMQYGHKHNLEFKDLYDINPEEHIDTNLKEYHQIQHRKPTPLLITLWKLSWKLMTFQFILVLFSTALYFSDPYFLNLILNHLTNRGSRDSEPEWVAYLYVTGILVTALARFALEGQISLIARKLGLRIKNILSGLIYRKALRRVPKLSMNDERGDKKSGDGNGGDDGGASVGKIVNLMSVDATNAGEWVGMLYTPFITFIQIVLCILALVRVLGWPAIGGVVLMTVLMFAGTPMASSINSASYTLKDRKDSRINSMNEVLQGIKIIKLFAWEKQFEARVTAFREKELESYFKLLLLYTFNRVLWYSAPILTTFVTLGTYTKIAGRDLDATTAFTALSLFNLLRGPLQTFPDTLVGLLDVWVAVKRIKDFLLEEDLERFGENETLSEDATEMRFTGATFEWPNASKPSDDGAAASENFFKRMRKNLWKPRVSSTSVAEPVEVVAPEPSFKLMDVDLEFPTEKLSVVIGATGSGKTSLLLSLLGETRRLSGTRTCPNSVAFVSQTAWLTNATIRQNILFGSPWDPVKYRRVVQACALVKDFEVLDGGDQTEVGEKGINLSGGQVLLDDPLSAVDAPTARHLFEKCILGLLAKRTRILVTNAVGLAIPCANHLIVINSGRVSLQGPVDAVIQEIVSSSKSPASSPFADGLAEMSDTILSERAKYLSNPILCGKHAAVQFLESLDEDSAAPVYTTEISEGGTKLTEDEKIETGNVKLKVYGLYFNAIGGVPFFLILLAGYCLNHGLATFQDVVIAWWSNQYSVNSTAAVIGAYAYEFDGFSSQSIPRTWLLRNNTTGPGRGVEITNYYLSLYGIVGGLCIFSVMIRLLILNYGQLQAARSLHSAMLKRILRAPLRFFEVTPLGRVMNRFTKDMSSIDWEVGNSAASMTYFVVAFCFVIGTVASVIPAFIFFLIPIGYIYVRIGLYYIRTSRSLKRVESTARSPIFSHFSETLNGVTTIRAFNELSRFSAESSRRFNDSNCATYYLAISNLWLSIRIEAIGTLIVFCAGVLIVATGVAPGLAGLCLNFTLSLTHTLISLVRFQSWMEMAMNSIERCDEYLSIDQEAAAIDPENRPATNWPNDGKISIQELEMRYSADSPVVLHGISAEIGAREKVGVIGRTGAGKSSLTMAMFRIVEPSGGKIVIDGVDVSQIGLEDLRSRLTIIPQDPVLFAGTVRSNLDPFGLLTDSELWTALKRAHLVPSEHDKVTRMASTSSINTLFIEDETESSSLSIPHTETGDNNEFSLALDSPISEGGLNLSAGQRQLLSLARALARGSKIILLDEATASVDNETDARIQATIRSEFANSTVLTIAHRLKTIADYDRVIVLDHGRIIENGRPIDLIENSDLKAFRKMCQETGEFDELVEIARTAATQSCL